MSAAAPLQMTAAKPTAVSSAAPLLQRKCACGGSGVSLSGKCDECQSKMLQRKIAIGATNDPLEAEADRVAEEVMRDNGPTRIGAARPRIQRVSSAPQGEGMFAPPSVREALASPGQALDPGLVNEMDHSMNHDFSRVRLHMQGVAERSAQEVNARAYTVGEHVVFASGAFRPDTAEGRRLLVHELVHVAQQSASGASLRLQRAAGSPAQDAESSEAMWRAMVGESSTSVRKLARPRRYIRLLERPANGAKMLKWLMLNELVQVERRTKHGWCWVVSLGDLAGFRAGALAGKTGFCDCNALVFDPPEPGAFLYQVSKGENLGSIARRFYGDAFSGEDNVRLYVEALYWANRGRRAIKLNKVELSFWDTVHRFEEEERTVRIHRGAQAVADQVIWIPSRSFIQQLKSNGAITSGSSAITLARRRAASIAADMKYAAGFAVGVLEGAWSAISDLFEGIVDAVALVGKTLFSLITGDVGAIVERLVKWVELVCEAYKARGAIAEDFMEKWRAGNGWDRGQFQGKVLGWVMMTALTTLITLGVAAVPITASKSLRTIFQVLKKADALGDITTYAMKAGGVVGKLSRQALGMLRGKIGSAARRGDSIVDASLAKNNAVRDKALRLELASGTQELAATNRAANTSHALSYQASSHQGGASYFISNRQGASSRVPSRQGGKVSTEQRIRASTAMKLLEEYYQVLDRKEAAIIRSDVSQVLREARENKGLKYQDAEKKIVAQLNRAKEFAGENVADVVVFSNFKVVSVVSVPRRANGVPILDRVYEVRLPTGKTGYIFVEVKGGENTKLGSVWKRTFKREKDRLVTKLSETERVKQASGEWYFYKLVEIAESGKRGLAERLLRAAKEGRVVDSLVIKSGRAGDPIVYDYIGREARARRDELREALMQRELP